MKKCLVKRKESERQFLEQLLDTSKLENYSVPVEIKAQLRQYQQVSDGSEILQWPPLGNVQALKTIS